MSRNSVISWSLQLTGPWKIGQTNTLKFLGNSPFFSICWAFFVLFALTLRSLLSLWSCFLQPHTTEADMKMSFLLLILSSSSLTPPIFGSHVTRPHQGPFLPLNSHLPLVPVRYQFLRGCHPLLHSHGSVFLKAFETYPRFYKIKWKLFTKMNFKRDENSSGKKMFITFHRHEIRVSNCYKNF